MPNAAHAPTLRADEPVDPREDAMERWARAQLGSVLEGRYRLEQVLGCGTTGAVFRGVQLPLGRDVAIKVLHEALRTDPRAWARFEREVKGAARLSHRNCVQILDLGQGFFVMPFLRGRELAAVIDRGTPLPVALDLFDQILAGLEHAHGHGLIHRDIKPENMLLVDPEAGGWPRIVLLDFGIAKLDAPCDGVGPTLVGEVFGTPQYMSPEQARGEAVTTRTDLYSAGLVLYELLTGQAPFQGDDPFVLMCAQLREPPPPLPSPLPAELAPLLDGLLAKDPQQRFASATAVRTALASIVAQLGVPRPAPAYPVRATFVPTRPRPPLREPRRTRRGRGTRLYASRDTVVATEAAVA